MLDYYHISHEASIQIGDHPGLQYLQGVCRISSKVLDVGCGDGTRLVTLMPPNSTGWGIDINPQAIKKASNSYPKFHFIASQAEKLPFPDNHFDLVYSAFALEHVASPQSVIDEMLRVCKSKGLVIFLCPNYGAPNRRSPVSIQNPYLKLIIGFLHDLWPSSQLNWLSVTPRSAYNQIDDDTTYEPYLLSLSRFLTGKHFCIRHQSSLWEIEPRNIPWYQQPLRILGKLQLPPFKYWGPQLFLVAQKP